MNKLMQYEIDTKNAIQETLETRGAELIQAVDEFNQIMEEAQSRLGVRVDAFNDAVRGAESFRQEINSDQEEHLDAWTDQTRESGAGQAYEDWADAWGREFKEVSVDLPKVLDFPDLTALDAFRDLALAP